MIDFAGMNILVTNDDGVFADGLWTLVNSLKDLGGICVVVPDREQSATGTSVTLRQPLRIRRIDIFDKYATTHIVEGTPSDSVILGLGKLVENCGLVISGINQGLNLGDDVLISGTVGAALQGYLRGLNAMAVSVPPESSPVHYQNAAAMAGIIVKRIASGELAGNVFFNLNVPALPRNQMRGIKVCNLAHRTHIDTVQEGFDGRRDYYWLVRQQLSHDVAAGTDIWALEKGYITISLLNVYLSRRPYSRLTPAVCQEMFLEFQNLPGDTWPV